jgi:putative membrane protein
VGRIRPFRINHRTGDEVVYTIPIQIGFEGSIWLHIKILLVLLLAGFHGFLASCRKKFANNKNKYSQKFYRIINEVPTILMIGVVALVILKPF